MAVRTIHQFPDQILSQPCPFLTHLDPKLGPLLHDLRDTLKSSPGVGIAAPQIGEKKRCAIVNIGVKKKPRANLGTYHGEILLLNPELINGEGKQIPREGCLSVPDYLANVTRFMSVTIKTQDLTGKDRLIQASGFEALALQHEIDHLNGVLFLDRIANLKTDLFRRKNY